MGPQLREHDRVLVSRTAYRLHDPRRGDIVVFPSPSEEPDDRGLVGGLVDDVLEAVALKAPGDDDLIKRVIGLPGETISARDGTVVIDGRRLVRSEEHTSELQSLMRTSYAVFCLTQQQPSQQKT